MKLPGSLEPGGLFGSMISLYLQWNMVPPQDLQVWVFMLSPLSMGLALFSQSGQFMAPADLSATGWPLPAEPPALNQTVSHFGQATAVVGPELVWQETRARAAMPRNMERMSCVFI